MSCDIGFTSLPKIKNPVSRAFVRAANGRNGSKADSRGHQDQ